MVNWKYGLSFPMFICQDLILLCIQLILFVLLYHITMALLIVNGLFYFPNDFCVNHLDVPYWHHLVMVSCFVIKEDSLGGYLSFSGFAPDYANGKPCSDLWHQTCPCCAVQRQPAHTEQVGGCGTVFAFLWFSCEGKVEPFQVCFLLVGGNRKRQQCMMMPSPTSPLAPPLSALCVSIDFAT